MKNHGFTLVELATSIAIVALLVSVISVAAVINKEASLRKILTEVDTIRNAVGEFYSGYGYLPGDFPGASLLWCSSACPGTSGNAANCMSDGTTAGYCNGNGDAQITGYWTVGCQTTTCNESLRAWQHLSLAGMYPGNFTGISAVASQTDATNAPFSSAVPLGMYYFYADFPSSQGSIHKPAILFGKYTASDPPLYPTLTPLDAYKLDFKVDDANAGTGNWLGYTGAGATACANGSGVYSQTYTTTQCQMHINLGIL
jgi:prepilin-type N-terminal cleavage/methylation domain-containing protein